MSTKLDTIDRLNLEVRLGVTVSESACNMEGYLAFEPGGAFLKDGS
jgi:hypothetical protein